MAADLRGALIVPKPVHRAAVTTPKAAGELLRALDAFESSANTLVALRLLPHVFVRPGELRFAEWADFDLDKAIWTIPPHKTKMRRAHTVPLSHQALTLIAAIEHDADHSSFLFPSRRSTERPMSENTINAALRRLGYLQSNGGEWIEDTVEVPDGITIICAECYRQREADARLAGRRTIRHG